MINKITYRCAFEHDLNELKLLSKETINSDYRSFLGDEAVDYFINSGLSDQYIMENWKDTLVFVMNKKIIGLCVTKENLIDLLMIHPNYQRLGIGSKMLEFISMQLFKYYTEIHVESFELNKKANLFYEKNGWLTDKALFDEEIQGNKIYYYKKK